MLPLSNSIFGSKLIVVPSDHPGTKETKKSKEKVQSLPIDVNLKEIIL